MRRQPRRLKGSLRVLLLLMMKIMIMTMMIMIER